MGWEEMIWVLLEGFGVFMGKIYGRLVLEIDVCD